jgi:DNA mismatch repair ATPase MutS
VLGPGAGRLSFDVHPRDEAGHHALDELRARGINFVADALSQSADHVTSFFVQLRAELAFYVACLNLYSTLLQKGYATCLPVPLPASDTALTGRALYDVSLALTLEGRAVDNDVNADGKRLVVVTGANQGGKSTFLRSVGLAQLMMQAGMFVAAREYRANVAEGLFTHFKREEDATMISGKLDEELRRMSRIVDQIQPGAILFANESFASTNEREGSDIGEEVVRALNQAGVKVLLVTHLYDLAERLRRDEADGVLFLRAERLRDGTRTFSRPGEALATSFGKDLYDEIFGADGSRRRSVL